MYIEKQSKSIILILLVLFVFNRPIKKVWGDSIPLIKEIKGLKPEDQVKRLDGLISRVAMFGYDPKEFENIDILLDARTNLCRSKVNCDDSWLWLRYVCSDKALESSEKASQIMEKMFSFLTKPTQVKKMFSKVYDISTNCASKIIRSASNVKEMPASVRHSIISATISNWHRSKRKGEINSKEMFQNLRKTKLRDGDRHEIAKSFLRPLMFNNQNLQQGLVIGKFLTNVFLDPEAYVIYINKNKHRLLKETPSNIEMYVDLYCESAKFINRKELCFNLLGQIKKVDPSWQTVVRGGIEAESGNLAAGLNIIKNLFPNNQIDCSSNIEVPYYAYYYLGKIFRVKGNLPESNKCFNQFAKKTETPIDAFLYNLENFKNQRLSGIGGSLSDLEKVRKKDPTKSSATSILTLMIEMEQCKSALISKSKATEVCQNKIGSLLEDSSNLYYENLFQELKSYKNSSTAIKTDNVPNLDILDWRELLKARELK